MDYNTFNLSISISSPKLTYDNSICFNFIDEKLLKTFDKNDTKDLKNNKKR